MSRSLQYLNFIGVFTLAVLGCMQWRTNRELNLKAIDLEKTRLAQTAKIDELNTTIEGDKKDLEDFRQRLELSEAALKEVQDKLVAMTTERDQLKADLDKWIAAVAQRDAALKQANEQIQKIIGERNDAITKFNDLANKYNAVLSKGK